MKTIRNLGITLILTGMLACQQDSGVAQQPEANEIPEKADTLAMHADTLNTRLLEEIKKEVIARKALMAVEALTIVGETQNLLQLIFDDKIDSAISTGQKLIGKLEVLLTKEPDLALLPVDARYQVNEVITDLETVERIVDEAEEAVDKEYYQVARQLFDGLKSEVVISSYYLPTATYPEAIKVAVALLEDGKKEAAAGVLQQVLATLVIENTVIPLPVLKAEQMVIEAAAIDAQGHDNFEDVINLIENADYQLRLAEAMGYGKKDKEYKELYSGIKALKRSVKDKADSQPAFDSLKNKMLEFKNRLFPISNRDSR